MASTFAFTVTQYVSSFTATINSPLALSLANVPDSVVVTQTTSTIRVSNIIQPVTISGGQVPYNQSLNTVDNVSFASVTTPVIYGAVAGPVIFPTGISVPNSGTVSINTLDFGLIK